MAHSGTLASWQDAAFLLPIRKPTICWAALGTNDRALRMQCTPHLCHEAPTKTVRHGALGIPVSVAGDQPHAREAEDLPPTILSPRRQRSSPPPRPPARPGEP